MRNETRHGRHTSGSKIEIRMNLNIGPLVPKLGGGRFYEKEFVVSRRTCGASEGRGTVVCCLSTAGMLGSVVCSWLF